jgi:hypothetical protein
MLHAVYGLPHHHVDSVQLQKYLYTRVTVFAAMCHVAGRDKVLPLDLSSARARGSQPSSYLHILRSFVGQSPPPLSPHPRQNPDSLALVGEARPLVERCKLRQGRIHVALASHGVVDAGLVEEAVHELRVRLSD